MPGLLVVVLLLPVVLVFGPAVMLGGLLRWRALTDASMRVFSRAVLAVSRARLLTPAVEGAGWPPSMVVVCNHESLLDGPALVLVLRRRSLRFVAKRELFWLPIFGQALALSGAIPVVRHDSARDRAALQRRIPPGDDVLFFAEGTRSRDGSLHPFRKGAFHFAISHGLPILPVAAGGGYEVHPPGSWWVRPGKLALAVGEPMLPEPGEDASALAARVYDKVASLRAAALAEVGVTRR